MPYNSAGETARRRPKLLIPRVIRPRVQFLKNTEGLGGRQPGSFLGKRTFHPHGCRSFSYLLFATTNTTAAVHDGNRLKNGTSSPRNAGRNATCQPSRTINAAPTPISSASFHGATTPSMYRGSRPTCTASAATAIARAAMWRTSRQRAPLGDGSTGVVPARDGSSGMGEWSGGASTSGL